MRSHKLTALTFLIGLTTVLVSAVHAEQGSAEGKATTGSEALVYRPPLRGAPGGRIGGGSRGPDGAALTVLAPDHTGFTVKEQPSVYWILNRSTSSHVELTLVDVRTGEAVVETWLPGPVEPGIHQIRFGDYGVTLAPDAAYRWFVAIVPDPDRRSKDTLAGGVIQRSEAPQELTARLARADRTERPALYAGAGLWYDAFDSLSDLLETRPGDPTLLRQRATLLRQVGLSQVTE